MKIEKLRNNHKKKIIIGGMIGLSVLTVGIFASSYSKYRVTESIKLGEGIINYTGADFEVVGMYLINKDGPETEIDTVPGNGYTLNTEKTKCTVNDVEITASIEYKDNKLYFGDITNKGTKCKIYFENKPKASDTIIAGNNPKPGTDSFTKTATTVADSGLFSTQDDDGTTYYYRGVLSDDTVNNWVDFAGFKWRIIRINGDGSIRMIYNGTSTTTTGTGTQIGVSEFNTNCNDNATIGFMYGAACNSMGLNCSTSYETAHANTNSSTIKGVLDNWYKTNIVDKNYDSYVSKEAGFCGDRQLVSGVGYKQNETVYGPNGRLLSNDGTWKSTQTPTYSCNTNDLFTVASSSKGNKALTYPVGLITSDEEIYAGGFGETSNYQFWLHTNQHYWTMSPNTGGGFLGPSVFFVSYAGYLNKDNRVNLSVGVRPVVNLASDIELTGNGTTSNPYKIVAD